MKKLIAVVNALTEDMLNDTYTTSRSEQHLLDLVHDIQLVINDMVCLLEYEVIEQEMFDSLLQELEEVFEDVTGELMGYYITIEEE